MPAQLPLTSRSTGSRNRSGRLVSRLGLTRTSPAISSPCSSASRIASVPPIDRPITKTSSHRSRSRARCRSISAYQSSQWVRLASATVVPWPGRRGSSTLRPASARYCAQSRRLCGLPVKPCTSSAPVGPPSWRNGSAPGISGMLAIVARRARHPLVFALVARAARAPRRRTHKGRCGGLFYWFLKRIVLGPVLRLIFRPYVIGAENVPAEGGAIFASNHLSFSDSIFLPLVVERRITFLAKADYFTGVGFKGWLTAKFFRGVGQLPVDRSGGSASEAALRTGLRILRRGECLGIYPEGTRSP